MGFEEFLKLLDKEDLGLALTFAVLGYTIDAVFFAAVGLPPGTVGGLSAAGAVGLKYLAHSLFRKRRLAHRAERLLMRLSADEPALAGQLGQLTGMWRERILDHATFEHKMNEIKQYLEKNSLLPSGERQSIDDQGLQS